MGVKPIALGGAALLLLLSVGTLSAAEDFPSSIKAGEEFRKQKKYDAALNQFDIAVTQSANNTDRGIALSKKAFIFAYDQKDFKAAREAADKAVGLEGAQPVARVMALQALAYCQMKSDKDYKAATETLEKATALAGVDWAMPSVQLMLGDCYRFTEKFKEALATYEQVVEWPKAGSQIKATAYLNMGITQQYNLNDPNEAKKCYAKAVELDANLKSEIDTHLAKLP